MYGSDSVCEDVRSLAAEFALVGRRTRAPGGVDFSVADECMPEVNGMAQCCGLEWFDAGRAGGVGGPFKSW